RRRPPQRFGWKERSQSFHHHFGRTKPALRSEARLEDLKFGARASLPWRLRFCQTSSRTKTARTFIRAVLLFTPERPLLHVVVEEKLIGMRPQPQGIVLLALGRDPHLDKV